MKNKDIYSGSNRVCVRNLMKIRWRQMTRSVIIKPLQVTKACFIYLFIFFFKKERLLSHPVPAPPPCSINVKCETVGRGRVIWNSASGLTTNEKCCWWWGWWWGVFVCFSAPPLCTDSSVSRWSALLWENGPPELPPWCTLTEYVAVCECALTNCVCVYICIRGHTCTGNSMALNRVSQLCHDITRLWLQLKMMTGRVCECLCVRLPEVYVGGETGLLC